MTPIEQAIEAIERAQECIEEELLYTSGTFLDAAIAALHGLQGDPVAVLVREIGEGTWFDRTPVKPKGPEFDAIRDSPLMDYCLVYSQPQSHVPDGSLSAFIAKKKSELDRYVSDYCCAEPDTGAGVWDSEYHQQHAEDLEQIIDELEAVLASQQGDSNESK